MTASWDPLLSAAEPPDKRRTFLLQLLPALRREVTLWARPGDRLRSPNRADPTSGGSRDALPSLPVGRFLSAGGRGGTGHGLAG